MSEYEDAIQRLLRMIEIPGEYFTPDPKPEKPIRLKRSERHNLYERVWERDKGICQICKTAYVLFGTPPHHKIFRSQGGSDTMENLITACPACHYRIHHGGK